ncbi:hypothetical protein MTR_4g043730 [Medicago truncatula]|uniref:Uncharacterized protein n=1 Tax=Medicago truncatula TaxID=3880 RepID=G7JVU2_MEDTR|nr:hypothetical protein MTR_4g043730 [Medicago truncatula]
MVFEYLSQSLWLTSECFEILVIRMIDIGLIALERREDCHQNFDVMNLGMAIGPRSNGYPQKISTMDRVKSLKVRIMDAGMGTEVPIGYGEGD